MDKIAVFRKDELIVLTSGYYSEFHYVMVGVALKDFDETDFEPYFDTRPEQRDDEAFANAEFAAWLVGNGFMRDMDAAELHVGGGHDYAPRRIRRPKVGITFA